MAKLVSRTSCLLVALLLLPGLLVAAERRVAAKSAKKPEALQVEMFAAMDAGQIEVKIIPKDSTEAKLFIKNKTKEPLNVKLPEAFVGVLAQALGGGGGLGGPGGGLGGGGNQGFGGGGGLGGPGGGGGFFQNIPAEKVGEVKLPIVCLEHGKRDPNPRVKYEIKPVEAVSTDPQLKSLLTLMGSGQYSQEAAQAAAWHVASKMSWETLAAKKINAIVGPDRPYFSRQTLIAALHMFKTAEAAAEKAESQSPGELAERQ